MEIEYAEEECDNKLLVAIEKLRVSQEQIQMVNKHTNEQIISVIREANELRKQLFQKRNEASREVPNFWFRVLANHPHIGTVFDEYEKDCLHFLDELEVLEFDDINSGFKINFYFKVNPYIENSVLTKEFYLRKPGTYSRSTVISWKEGHNIVDHIKQKQSRWMESNRILTNSFFMWYEGNVDPSVDKIAQAIKYDLWPNAPQYYTWDASETKEEDCEEDGSDDPVKIAEETDKSMSSEDDMPLSLEEEGIIEVRDEPKSKSWGERSCFQRLPICQ